MDNNFNSLKDWCLFIIDFINDKRESLTNIQDQSAKVIIEEFKSSIMDLTDGKSSQRQLKSIRKTLIDWSGVLKETELVELDRLLLNKFGKGLAEYKDADRKKINKILNRNRIINDSEYELLLNKIDEIFMLDEKKDELEKINNLLYMYQKRNN